jgi:hypothetical protein
MKKRGQLGIIEFKYFMVGFLVGLFGGWILVLLGTKKVLPFKIPLVCGPVLSNKFWKKSFWKEKKAQLGIIEFKYFVVGFLIGLVVALILVFLGQKGILPFKIPLVCPSLAK